MKAILILILTVVAAVSASAQTVPQPAFRLLDGYLEKRTLSAEYGAKVAPWFLMGTGLAVGGAAAAVWYQGDAIAAAVGQSRPDENTKNLVVGGLVLGAVVLTAIGLTMRAYPPAIDERADYAAVYHESDPALQEKLAAARLKSLAETAKSTRMVSGFANLTLTGVDIAFQLEQNRSSGAPWNHDLLSPWGWQGAAIPGALISLLVPSEEESLYNEYRAVVDAMTRD